MKHHCHLPISFLKTIFDAVRLGSGVGQTREDMEEASTSTTAGFQSGRKVKPVASGYSIIDENTRTLGLVNVSKDELQEY